jgi:hypothetical protein
MRKTIINKTRKNKTRKNKLHKKHNKHNKKQVYKSKKYIKNGKRSRKNKKNTHKRKLSGGDFNLRQQDYLRRFLNKIFDESEVDDLMNQINERSALEDKPGKFSYFLLCSLFLECIIEYNIHQDLDEFREDIKRRINQVLKEEPHEDIETDDETMSLDSWAEEINVEVIKDFERIVDTLPNKLY